MTILFKLNEGLTIKKSAKVSKYLKCFCEKNLSIIKITIQILVEKEETNKIPVTPPLRDNHE